MDPILVTKVEKGPGDAPVLIVDRQGSIGNAIYERIKQELLVVLVSGVQPEATQNLIYIPYKKRIPEIPNDAYSLIIYICDQEKDIGDLTKEFIGKAKQDNIKFVFVTDYEWVNTQLIEKTCESYDESYTLILGELFGNSINVSPIDRYIHQAAAIGTIQLPFMGLRKMHPVLFDDAIQAILQAIFGIRQQHRITFLYQRHLYTDLSIAHILQKTDPLLHVDFLKDNKSNFAADFAKASTAKKASADKEKEVTLPGNYFFDKDYALPEKITDMYKNMQSVKKSKVDAYIYKEEFKPLLDLDQGSSPIIPYPLKKGILYLLYCLLIIILIPFITLGIVTFTANNALLAAKTAIEHGDISGAKQQVSIATGSFIAADMTKSPILFELHAIGAGDVANQLEEKIHTGKEITAALENLFTAAEKIQGVVLGKTIIPNADLFNAISLGRSSLASVQDLTTGDSSEKELVDKIGKYQRGIDLLTGTINILPNALGITGKKTYLVLFENNMELRPGGGFIGSYGLVSFEDGKMGNMAIHDVYDADGQLKQHVDPPFAIRRFMGNVHLYLRDSNFDVDFVNNARQASQMFQLETGQHVDGVVSIDLTFVKYLLAATGPVYVPEYDTSVDENNFFILAEDHAEKNSFAGSTQKKDFLRSVFMALQQKLLTQKQVNSGNLIQKLVQSIQEKHFLFALADISSQNILTANHLSSSLWDSRTETHGTINDFMGINDANIGVNIANYFINRSVKQSVSIDGDGTLKGEVDVQYHNASPNNQGPGGDYKNYMRIILPKNTTLTGITLDGTKQATRSAITDPFIYETKGFKAPNELEVEKTEEFGKTMYGFLVTIPISTTKTVAITYEHNQKINLGNPVLHYNLRLFKQPGTDNDPFAFNFNYPLEYSILSASPEDTVNSNSDYSLSTQLSEDKTISVDLTKK